MRACLIALSVLTAATVAAEHLNHVQRTVALPAGGSVSIETSTGAITITGWDRDEVALDVARHVPAEGDLARLPVDLVTEPGRVRLRVVPANGLDPDLRADIEAHVPRRLRAPTIHTGQGNIVLTDLKGTIEATTERGAIIARGIAGKIRLEATVGSVTAEPALGSDDALHCRVFDGNATVIAAGPLDATVQLVSLNGKINSDFPLTVRDKFGPRAASGTLGGGAAILTVDVVNGDIALRKRAP